MLSDTEERQPTARLTKSEIEEKLRQLAPFHHNIDLPYGLKTYLPEAARHDRERTRVQSFVEHAWPSILEACGGSLKGLRVLDLACNCGGFSVLAAQSGADYVLGVDVEPHYIEQAGFIKQALGIDNIHFEVRRIEELDPAVHGRFDVTFCFGILYHLQYPVWTMQQIAELTDKLIVVDTHLLRFPYINPFISSPLWDMRLVPAVDESARNITTSRWRKKMHCQMTPNVAAVKALLTSIGFGDVTYLKPKARNLEKRYYKGKRGTFIGRRVVPLVGAIIWTACTGDASLDVWSDQA
jgi:tRNA (mo5U34)-methyltransferase